MEPIGVFDSGLGGLSVLQAIRRIMPTADLVYIADRAHAPYGERSLEDVRRYAGAITEHLATLGTRVVVIACNTASAAALHHLRAVRRDLQFVGMEPAVKPAAESSRNRRVGVVATRATFQGELFSSVVDRHASGVAVITRACDGWADLVEHGVVEGPEATALVERHLHPLLAHGIDTLVLGCTHYPFLVDTIRRVAGPEVGIVDPSDAVARQTARVADRTGDSTGHGTTRVLVSGPVDGVGLLIHRLTGLELTVGPL